MNLNWLRLVLLLALCLQGGFCVAQVIPKTVEPGRYEKEFDTKTLPEFKQPKLANEVVEKPLKNINDDYFYISAVIVRGSTIYKNDDIVPIYEDLLTEKVTFSDITYIADSLTAKYRNDGYILSKVVIPMQEIEDGIVYLDVIEGKIDKVLTPENQIKLTTLMNKYAEKIASPNITNISELERYLLLMNDLPGVEVKGTLLPAKIKQASDIHLKTQHKQLAGRLSIDNWGTRYLGPIQASTYIEGNNFTGNHESTSLRAVRTARSSELRYFELTEKVPLGSEGTTLEAKMRYSRSSPGSDLQALDVKSRSSNFSATIKHPIIRSRTKNLYTWATFEHQQSKVTSFGNKLSEDRIRLARIGMMFDWVDSLHGVNLFNLETSYGLDVLGASHRGGSNLSRVRGVGVGFSKTTMDMARLQKVTDNINVLGYLSSQYSSHALLAAEEFGFGGASFGKGYDPSEITGDHGVALKFEAQYNQKTELNWVEDYQAFIFYDIGVVMNKDREANEPLEKTAASAGIGIRSKLKNKFSASVEIAKPLTRGVQSQGENQKNATFFMRLGKDF